MGWQMADERRGRARMCACKNDVFLETRSNPNAVANFIRRVLFRVPSTGGKKKKERENPNELRYTVFPAELSGGVMRCNNNNNNNIKNVVLFKGKRAAGPGACNELGTPELHAVVPPLKICPKLLLFLLIFSPIATADHIKEPTRRAQNTETTRNWQWRDNVRFDLISFPWAVGQSKESTPPPVSTLRSGLRWSIPGT